MEGEKEFNKGYEDARKDFIDGKSATLQLDGYKSELYCDGYQTATEDFKKLMRHHMLLKSNNK